MYHRAGKVFHVEHYLLEPLDLAYFGPPESAFRPKKLILSLLEIPESV